MPSPLWYDAGEDHTGKIIPGTLVKVPLYSKTVIGLVFKIQSKQLPFKTRCISEILNIRPFPNNWMEMISWISSYYQAPLSKVLNSCLPKSVLTLLLSSKKKLKNAVKQQSDAKKPVEISLQLTPEQSEAVNNISPWITGSKCSGFKSFLLHGITGSGKTLVYLHLIKACLLSGKNALILLPEIALTPQIMGIFSGYLNTPVFPMHSNLNAAQKRGLWNALTTGDARVIVGVRSAALCPLENIGLIIVDEEHDSSYKQSDVDPRYNARDVAVYRAKQNGCPIILGSATPSLESYFLAKKSKYQLINMPNRATNSPPPEIHIVDMREQYELQGDTPLSIPLRDALTDSLQNGEQAIILLNRRGFSKKRICVKCGTVKNCPDCLTIMIHHKSRHQLRCHSCNYLENADTPCRKCGENRFLDIGMAIEQMEEHILKLYPGYGLVRLDSDTTVKKGEVGRIIEEFASGKAKILLGTQMVAKGHDFVSVNLVGVIDADTGLGIPDFRAQERIFQLITQVSGRAGRHSRHGKVYIQTFQPENPTFTHAFTQNYHQFFQEEMKLREELSYPPFSRMIKAVISSPTANQVTSQMDKFYDILKNYCGSVDVSLIGPGSPIQKKQNLFICQIFGKGKISNQIRWAFSQAIEKFMPQKDSRTRINLDVDPVSII